MIEYMQVRNEGWGGGHRCCPWATVVEENTATPQGGAKKARRSDVENIGPGAGRGTFLRPGPDAKRIQALSLDPAGRREKEEISCTTSHEGTENPHNTTRQQPKK